MGSEGLDFINLQSRYIMETQLRNWVTTFNRCSMLFFFLGRRSRISTYSMKMRNSQIQTRRSFPYYATRPLQFLQKRFRVTKFAQNLSKSHFLGCSVKHRDAHPFGSHEGSRRVKRMKNQEGWLQADDALCHISKRTYAICFRYNCWLGVVWLSDQRLELYARLLCRFSAHARIGSWWRRSCMPRDVLKRPGWHVCVL